MRPILTDARDMRVLAFCIFVRQSLGSKTLQEDLQMILKELTDKSNIIVYTDMVRKCLSVLKIISLEVA